MRVAIVHDWLNTKLGGAERVLIELSKLYPDAPIYTLLYDQERFGDAIDPVRIRPSALKRLPAALRKRPRYLLPLLPVAIEQFDLTGFDVVICSSAGWSKGVITRPETLQLCYCYSPMRFVWDYWPAYLEEQHLDRLRRAAVTRLVSRLRLWDYYSAARVDQWVAISETVQKRIGKYYRKPAELVYPPANLTGLRPGPKKDQFAIISTLTPYKKIDNAIAAFNANGRRLVIAGDGSDRARLQKMARPNISFVGFASEADKADLLSHSRAVIFPGEDDFGLVPVEALAAGTPVVALRRGGVTETITNGATGILYEQPTAVALNQALERHDQAKFEPAKLVEAAQRFDREHFLSKFPKLVEQAYQKHQREFSNRGQI